MKCANFSCSNDATKRLNDKEKDVTIYVCDYHFELDFKDEPRLKEDNKK